MIVWLIALSVVGRYVGLYRSPSADVAHYAMIADFVHHGWWPYAQYPFEYPPLALVPILAPPTASVVATYQSEFRVVMIVVLAATAVVTTAAAAKIWPTVERPLGVALAFAFGVTAIGITALNRFDGTVALVVAATMLCLVSRRWAWAGLLVGLGFSLKLMPIVLLPLVLVLARTWRRGTRVVLLAAAGAIIPFVPFLIRGPGSLWTSLFGGQVSRGLGIESVAATPYLLADLAGLGHVHVVVPYGGSTELTAPGTSVLVASAPLAVLLLVLLVYVVVWRVRSTLRRDNEVIALAALAAILATICGNKLISPQHLIWLLPLAALGVMSKTTRYRLPAALVLAAAAVTQAEFPFLYGDVVDLRAVGVLTLALRNGLLVAAYIAALVVLWRPGRQEVPAATPDPQATLSATGS